MNYFHFTMSQRKTPLLILQSTISTINQLYFGINQLYFGIEPFILVLGQVNWYWTSFNDIGIAILVLDHQLYIEGGAEWEIRSSLELEG